MFKLGSIVMTNRIHSDMVEDEDFTTEISRCVARYIREDFTDSEYPEDIMENKRAVLNGSRILAPYKTSKGKIYIITESDRSHTTILYADEY